MGAVGGRSRIGCRKRERKEQKWIEAGVNAEVTRAGVDAKGERSRREIGAGVDAAEREAVGNAVGERSRSGQTFRERGVE